MQTGRARGAAQGAGAGGAGVAAFVCVAAPTATTVNLSHCDAGNAVTTSVDGIPAHTSRLAQWLRRLVWGVAAVPVPVARACAQSCNVECLAIADLALAMASRLSAVWFPHTHILEGGTHTHNTTRVTNEQTHKTVGYT